MNRTILFFVSAGSQIGLGHLMRCLSIAHALRGEGISCFFVVETEYVHQVVKEQGFLCYQLKQSITDGDGIESELPVLVYLIKSLEPMTVIVDSYQVTKTYLATLMGYTRVVYMDDVCAFPYPCDVLVNYNIYAPEWKVLYRQSYQGKCPSLILGPTYAPLREDFQNLPPRESRLDVRHVLLSTGGSDPENIAQKLLSLVQKTPDWEHIQFHIVIGSMNPNKSELVHMAQMIPNVQIHVAIKDMAHLMQMCDMAVAAAGSTLYELCACGTPTVTYILADNQIPGAQEFERQGLMLNAGDCRQSDFMLHLFEKMMTLLTSVKMRRMMSAQMQRTVDGFGAKRLAQELLKNISKP